MLLRVTADNLMYMKLQYGQYPIAKAQKIHKYIAGVFLIYVVI